MSLLNANMGAAFSNDSPDSTNGITQCEAGGLRYVPGALQVIQDGNQLVKLANTLSPLEAQSTVKIANTRIANVYQTLAKGTIPPTAHAVNVSGQQIFCELSVVASQYLNDGITPTGIQIPALARIELRLPNSSDVTNSFARQLVLATFAALCDEKGSCRVTDIMRGVTFREF